MLYTSCLRNRSISGTTKQTFDGNSIYIKKILQEGVSEIYAEKREENELNYVISSVVTNKQS